MYVFSFPKRDGAERRNVCLYLIGHVMSNNKVPILAPCTLIESQLNVRAQPKQLCSDGNHKKRILASRCGHYGPALCPPNTIAAIPY